MAIVKFVSNKTCQIFIDKGSILKGNSGEVGIINLNNKLSVVQMQNGKILFPFEYEEIKPTDVSNRRYWIHDSWYIVKKDGKYGCVKPDGAVILPLEYDEIFHLFVTDSDSYSDTLYIKKGSKHGRYIITHRNMLAGYGGDESTYLIGDKDLINI